MWLREFKRADLETLIPYDPKPVVDTGKTDVVNTNQMCFSCHDGFVLDSRFMWKKGTHSHPVGKKPSDEIIIPRIKGKEVYPLNDDGKTDCGTCHTAHGVDWAQSESAVFMRVDNANGQLCIDCHEKKKAGPEKGNHPISEELDDVSNIYAMEKAGARFGDGHTLLCESCHKPHGAPAEKILVLENDQSQLCGACHDERDASDLKEATRMGTHPVNVKPDRVRIPELFKDEKLGAKLGKKGEIICETCHRPHDAVPDTSILVMNNQQPDLCGPDPWKEATGSSKPGLCEACHEKKKQVIGSNHDLRLTAPEEQNSKEKTTEQSGVCGACHVVHEAEGPFLWARKLTPNIEDKLSAACISCHDEPGPAEETIDIEHSHPVDVDMKRRMIKVTAANEKGQSPLPLYNEQGRHSKKDGKVTCGSCHDPHTWTAEVKKGKDQQIATAGNGIEDKIPQTTDKGKADLCDDDGHIIKKRRKGDGRNSFLRLAAAPDSNLCVECHQDQRRVISTNHDLNISAPKEKNQRDQTVANSGVCGQCHTPHKAKGPALWARKIGPGKAAIETLCKDCHQAGSNAKDKLTGTHSHPVGIELGSKMDTRGLPTFSKQGKREKSGKGLVDCATCHNPHGGKPTGQTASKKPGTKAKPSYQFLRKANSAESELCRTCHKKQSDVIQTKHDLRLTSSEERNINDQTLEQSGICGACHVVHNATGPFIWGRKQVAGTDKATATCMTCHDSQGPAKEKGIGEQSHPVDVDIKPLAIRVAKGKWSSENPRTKLTPLPLYDKQGRHARTNEGRVSCGTCHDPHVWSKDGKTIPVKDIKKFDGGPDDSFLRIADRGKSALCTNCHLDQKPVLNTKHNVALFLAETKEPVKHGDEKMVLDRDEKVTAYGSETAPAGDQLSEFGDGVVRRANKQARAQAGGADGGICSTCHMPHKAKGPLLWARDTGPGKGPIEVLCKDCHQNSSNAKDKLTGPHDHPVGIEFSKNMDPRDLPTYSRDGKKKKDNKGLMDCTTCHDPHRWQPQDKGDGTAVEQLVEGDGSNSFLRIAAAPSSQLCIECHEDQRMVVATDHDLNITAPKATNRLEQQSEESGVCGQCHTPHNGISQFQWARQLGEIGDGNKNLAEGRCLSCHREGEVAAHKIPPTAKHPEEVSIWSSALISSPLRERALPELPFYNKTGELDDSGVISCSSCHNPHQWDPDQKAKGPGKNVEGNSQTSFLRMTSSESFICADCHGEDSLFRYMYFHKESAHEKNHLYLGVPTGPPTRRQRQ
jgi:predicted CXXCH cytochrome family protein